MIISHKHKLIFLRNRKTASTSLEIFLANLCTDCDVVTPIFPPHANHVPRNYLEQGFYNHMPALEVSRLVGPTIWNEYTSFCVERNPWDKTISHYFMLKHRSSRDLSLLDYFNNGEFCTNYPIYTDPYGEIMVDHVLRYESLNRDLGKLFTQLCIPFNDTLGIMAKSEYRPKNTHYRKLLNEQQRDEISQVFQAEIDAFGYRF